MADAMPADDPALDSNLGPSPGTIAYLARLQGDGRLMLRYLMELPKRSSMPAADDPARGLTPAILFEPAARLAADPQRTTGLIQYVDFLSRTADPVSLATVRETYRFLGQDQNLNGTPPRHPVLRTLVWLRVQKGLVVAMLLGFALLVMSVYFLVQVDDGRRTMQQLAANRADVTAVYNDLGKVEGAPNWVIHLARKPFPPAPDVALAVGAVPVPGPGLAGPGLPGPGLPGLMLPALATQAPSVFIPFCQPPLPTVRVATDPAATPAEAKMAREAAEKLNKDERQRIVDESSWRIPATPQADMLCARLSEIQLREALIFIRLTAWNERLSGVATMFSVPPFSLDYPQCPPVAQNGIAWPSHVACDDWQRTELRTAATIAVLTGYVLPLMLGGLGGCVAGIRRLQLKVAQRTLNDSDSFNCLLQVILGMTLGGLLGAVFSTDTPVRLGEYQLTLVALGFFVGFSLEVVFGLLDALVKAVTDLLRVGKPPPP